MPKKILKSKLKFTEGETVIFLNWEINFIVFFYTLGNSVLHFTKFGFLIFCFEIKPKNCNMIVTEPQK